MKFFNKKEQVIDLQITQYGKHMFSKGKFKPVYYSFYDDDILYDSQYGIGPETQNNIQERIIKDTPQLETQYVFKGIETEVKRAIKDVRSSKEYLARIHDPSLPEPRMLQPTADKMYSLRSEIGTSELNTDNSPAWNIQLFEGQITSSTPTLTGSHVTVEVPQLQMKDINYKTIVSQLDPGSENKLFEDGTFIDVLYDEGSILLSVEEINAFYGTSNFDIEVYEIKDEPIASGTIGPASNKLTKKQSLYPLYFIREDRSNNLDSDPSEFVDKLDSTYVEYFLEINTDLEISKDLLCEHTVDRTQGIFGNRELDCGPEKKQKEINARNIYNTDVTDGDLEDCS